MNKDIIQIDWLDKYHDSERKLMRISREIEIIAIAFMTTGNLIMYDTLRFIARDIEKERKNCQNALRESINEGYKKSRESTRELFERIYKRGMK